MKQITINLVEYINLRCESEQLYRLERGGVDNWEWYGEAMYPEDQPSLDEFRDNLEKELNEEN